MQDARESALYKHATDTPDHHYTESEGMRPGKALKIYFEMERVTETEKITKVIRVSELDGRDERCILCLPVWIRPCRRCDVDDVRERDRRTDD